MECTNTDGDTFDWAVDEDHGDYFTCLVNDDKYECTEEDENGDDVDPENKWDQEDRTTVTCDADDLPSDCVAAEPADEGGNGAVIGIVVALVAVVAVVAGMKVKKVACFAEKDGAPEGGNKETLI